MRGSKQREHTRLISTRKGRRRILINKGIRKSKRIYRRKIRKRTIKKCRYRPHKSSLEGFLKNMAKAKNKRSTKRKRRYNYGFVSDITYLRRAKATPFKDSYEDAVYRATIEDPVIKSKAEDDLKKLRSKSPAVFMKLERDRLIADLEKEFSEKDKKSLLRIGDISKRR